MTGETDDGVVDKTPDMANAEAFSGLTPGDPQVEYGVIDTKTTYPATTKMWQPEYPVDAPRERHMVVPVEVVARGYTRRKHARRAAEHMVDDEYESDRYKVVTLSDTRGV